MCTLTFCTWVTVGVYIPCTHPVHCQCQSRSIGPFSAQVAIDWPLMSPYGTVWEKCVCVLPSLCVSLTRRVGVWCKYCRPYCVHLHLSCQTPLCVSACVWEMSRVWAVKMKPASEDECHKPVWRVTPWIFPVCVFSVCVCVCSSRQICFTPHLTKYRTFRLSQEHGVACLHVFVPCLHVYMRV